MSGLLELAKSCIPSVDSILQEALSHLDIEQISDRFGEALISAERWAR